MTMVMMVKMTMITIQAPTGCFQYHFDTSGLMKSFNYEGGQYLNNQHYRICILASSDACQIEYTSEGEFMLEKWGNYKTVPYTRAGSTSTYCVQDYLSIPGASNSTSAPSSDRFCGGQLNSQYSYNDHHHHHHHHHHQSSSSSSSPSIIDHHHHFFRLSKPSASLFSQARRICLIILKTRKVVPNNF